MRPIPKQALDLIKEFEGLELRVYPDPATGGEPYTGGWGHTGPDVKRGMKVTLAMAEEWLRDDIGIASRKLTGVIKADVLRDLSDSQYAALLSFAFNLGAKASWTIWKVVNARQFDAVPAQIMRFNRAAGKVMRGLTRRRAAECLLWNAEAADEAPPSHVTRGVGVTPPAPEATKPLAQSKTMWTGGGVAAAGVASGATQVQALVAPQADQNEWLAQLAGILAVLIVGAGIAVMVFKWLDQKAKAR